jgi:SH3-like domain-containing protein
MPRHALTPRLPLILILAVLAALPACSVRLGGTPAPPPPAAAPVPAPRTERVTIQGLNLRQGPSSRAPAVGSLDRDEVVTVLERQGSWIRVRTMDGREGFAYGAYLTGFDIRPARPRPGKAGTAPEPGSSPPDGISREEEQELWK